MKFFPDQIIQPGVIAALKGQDRLPKDIQHKDDRGVGDGFVCEEKIDISDVMRGSVASRIGKRPNQEDTAGICTIGGKMSLHFFDPEMLSQVLHDAVARLAAEINELGCAKKSGSTLTVCLQCNGYIVTANVGDSKTMLARYLPTQGKWIVQSTTVEHKLKDPEEIARIRGAGGSVFFINGCNRVGGVLAIGRSLGHPNLRGITSEPSITVYETMQNARELIIQCSDGLTDVMNELDVAAMLNTETFSVDGLASVLCNESYLRGSLDNITVTVSPKSATTTLSFIADGHGGVEIANYVKARLPGYVVEEMNKRIFYADFYVKITASAEELYYDTEPLDFSKP